MQTEGQHRSQLSTNRPTKEYKCNKCNNGPKRRSPKAKGSIQVPIPSNNPKTAADASRRETKPPDRNKSPTVQTRPSHASRRNQ